MSAQNDQRRQAEELALMLSDFGMQRMSARVMAAFLFTEKPSLTLGELAEELDVSQGSVSGALKMLHHVGMLERVPVPGSRRDHHRLRRDAWERLYSRQNEVVRKMMAAAEEGIAATGEGSLARERLQEMYDFYNFMFDELPLLFDRWREKRDSQG
ncbi:GbsR/MarR family transcriptional regulator [Nocardiopsis endophytica]|uniref:GbsR/MarR family transcriptional regulator n=1 Tax=Nocardiopsis endophytica TaxID=3018445 RepID=UPI0022E8247B|nr:MarR family transcriptional regulator [Nocardiopsis endophytica]